MIELLLTLAIGAKTPYRIARNDFGMPKVIGQSLSDCFRGQGFADAQDRLWQMELSRRLAEGRLAQILGPKALPSDESILKLGYTAVEIESQINHLPVSCRQALQSYSEGVNDFIRLIQSGRATAPPEFKENQVPLPNWKPSDSAAIGIHLFDLFGSGGDGELRDWALFQYLQGRAPLKGSVDKVFDDIAFLNEPNAPTTVSGSDDLSSKPHPPQFTSNWSATKRQVASLPPASLFDLLPGIALSQMAASRLLAEQLATPFQTGSYCVVVGSKRSASGRPILLSGPQMGFTTPSIVHQIALSGKTLSVVGMDVPGVPGVLIGANRHLAWGLTSGVADVEDVFAFKAGSKADSYQFDGKSLAIQKEEFAIPVKGAPSKTIVQLRTLAGPVIARGSGGHGYFCLKRAYNNRELASLAAILTLDSATNANEADLAGQKCTGTFNLFFADRKGQFGWRYCGLLPLRSAGIDPRFPVLATKTTLWSHFLTPAQAPHAMNPREGLIVNWNTKSSPWWGNGDTPVWGTVFRSSVIAGQLKMSKISGSDVLHAVQQASRLDENWPWFRDFVQSSPAIANTFAGYGGANLDGSLPAAEWQELLKQMRKTLFLKSVGPLIGNYFDFVLQPSIVLKAMQGKTHFDYLAGRSASQVVEEAFKSMKGIQPYSAERISYPGHGDVLYRNRGTYIQLLLAETKSWWMRSIAPPGVSESGAHAWDEIPAAQKFKLLKPWQP